jgi:hypothetical protein
VLYFYSEHAMNYKEVRIIRYGTPEGIRTPDLLVRSQSLYPTELQARIFKHRYYSTQI